MDQGRLFVLTLQWKSLSLFQRYLRNSFERMKWEDLKVHKHEKFFLTFFAETETLRSQGPVTRDFENRIRFGRDIRLLNISAHAEHAMKSVPSMLSMR